MAEKLFALIEFNDVYEDHELNDDSINDSTICFEHHLKDTEASFSHQSPQYTVYELVPRYKVEVVRKRHKIVIGD